MQSLLPLGSMSSATPSTHTVCVSFAISLYFLYLILHELLTPPHTRFFPLCRKWHLPPGPPGLPLIGSLHRWRSVRRSPATLLPHLASLANYGDMTTLSLGSKT